MLGNLEWTFINGVSGLLTAVGTLSAVIVALWIATRDSRLRLKVHAGIRKMLLQRKVYERPGEEPDFLLIAVTNVGRRVVTVTGLLWKNRLVRRRWLFQMPGEAPLSAQLPARLQDGDEADFAVPLAALTSVNDWADFRAIIPKPRRFTARFLRIVVRTSTGEFVTAPLEKELREWFLAAVERKSATGATRSARD
jgi:hypothetical protein